MPYLRVWHLGDIKRRILHADTTAKQKMKAGRKARKLCQDIRNGLQLKERKAQ